MSRVQASACCGLCGSPDRMHRHHIDWNHDNNAADNVLVVCQRCHVMLHKIGFLDRDELLALRQKVMEKDPSRFQDSAGQTDLF